MQKLRFNLPVHIELFNYTSLDLVDTVIVANVIVITNTTSCEV